MLPLRPEHRRFCAPALLVAALAATACEGPNQFSGPSPLQGTGTGQGPRVEIQAPRGDSLTARPLGDSLFVQARVRDEAGVDSVRMVGVAFRGDPVLGTDRVVTRFARKTVVLNSVRDTVISRYLLATSDTTKEVVSIVVEAFDKEGNFSADTTRIRVGGPAVNLLNLENNQAVQAGLSLSLQLEAADPQGIIGIEFRISGAFSDTLRRAFAPPRESVRVDTAVAIPDGITGEIEILAIARNSLDVSGQDGPIRLRVVQGGGGDANAPSLSMTITSPTRLETKDSIRVAITAADDTQGSGIARVGVTVQALAPGRGVTETRVFIRDFDPPRTGTVTHTLAFEPFNIDPRILPDTLIFEFTGFAIDDAGNCAATVAEGQSQSLVCVTGTNGAVTAQSRAGVRTTRPVVAGRTVTLPAGGRIMDAAVDTVRKNLLLSNITRDRIEIFRLETEQFQSFVPVGSQPWGVALNREGDTLLVANSGGTNVTSVYLGPTSGAGPAFEVPGARFLTPDVRLFEVQRTEDGDGFLRYNVFVVPRASPPSFTDRPQFLVQDYTGRVLYSTKTTSVGNFGTIRQAFVPPGAPAPEVLLFWEHGALVVAEDYTGVANADNVGVVRGDFGDEAIIYDHVPGFPDQLIVAGPALVSDAVELARAEGSDAVAVAGRFSVNNIGFTDTTFVAISGDRRWGVFGEGRVEVGRVIMYDSENDVISDVVPVSDLMTNAAESVRGLGLNYDGTLGVARGIGAYFFTTDLRLQGVAPLPAGGAGAVLHPLHANARSIDNATGVYNPDTHLAFVGTGERTIDIVDTFHFFRSGRIFIRDVISGPLRAVLPFPGDNAGNQCVSVPVTDKFGNTIGETIEIFQGGSFDLPHPPNGPSEDRCIVLKLFGVTDTGGVVVIDVRKSDVLRNHPARN